MKRRNFITLLGGAAAAWPLVARAQQPPIPVIGFLSGRSLASDAHLVAAFRQGLKESGYDADRNVIIEFRWAEGQFGRLRTLAADLVAHQVDVIFAGGLDIDIRAVRALVTTTPIVLATGGDPVELGLVASFNRPGGNATAITVFTAALWPKRLELLRQLVASATVIGLLVNPNDVNAASTTRDVQVAAGTFGLQVRVVQATSERGIDTAFATLAGEHANVLLVTQNALFNSQREKLVALAARHALPAIYDRREFLAAGGLISYGASNSDQYYQSGLYVGRILKGDKPANLPVLRPTRFELVINTKTAKALGLAVPDKLIALADEVIE